MWGLLRWCTPSFGWISLTSKPIDSLLQGVIAACAVSVLNHLLRIHLHIQSLIEPAQEGVKAPKLHSQRQILDSLHLCILIILFATVGSRVSSLVVLEFSLRIISMLLSNDHGASRKQIFLLCQYSVGCGVTASLSYLNEGAPHSTLSLMLSTGLAGLIMWYVWRLVKHVNTMYELHSKERYCGVCILLLTTWHQIPKLLCNALKVVFMVADVAAFFVINRDFLTTSEAIRFWTPLTICYTLLVIYMQEEQKQNPTEQSIYQTVGVRMGGLLILTLTVGRWADVLHVILSLFGEMLCLLQAGTMMEACRQRDSSEVRSKGTVRQPQPSTQQRSRVSDTQTLNHQKDSS
ncbi:transmembrane protein 82 isoform X1 [Scyliorhinus canicula]|uniref:transmembrane protein 82 isoform X1 n=1 Tax=Scyliorhinus canicula TaxID=7830 RepID=UPI0018F622D5|nr:transmembrane protein 82 isoform X1 [Scyliorhinus canicula]